MKISRNIALSIFGILLMAAPAKAGYGDVSVDSQYYKAVSYLELQGASDNGGEFRPEAKINKAELFKILFKIFGEETYKVTKSKFTDVDPNVWYAAYAELALKYDLTDTKSKTFNASSYVNKVDAMTYLYKTYGIAAPRLTKEKGEELFRDISSAHPYFSFIKKAVDLGIIQKNPQKNFDPYKYVSRGEFADLLFKFDQWYTNESGSKSNTVNGVKKSEILADIWERITNDFYLKDGETIDEEALYQAAVKGMIESLNDPYTTFIAGNSTQELVGTLSGNFEGIGAYLVQDEITKKIYITDFVNGSNAVEVGMLVGDEIEEVNDIPVTALSYAEAVKNIKGAAGTLVKLKIRRGTQSHTFNVERRALKLELQKGEILDKNTWYVDINIFNDTSFIDVNAIMKELSSTIANPKAIIIDLRSNAGGYLNSAISIAGHFVKNSAPVVQLDYGSFVEKILNSGRGEYNGIPLYVLVDEFTASASEILAAAMRDGDDAILIGTKTFGKGTAQELTQYWDGSILKLTIAEWLTANGEVIQGQGLTPDIAINQKSKTIDLWLNAARREIKNL